MLTEWTREGGVSLYRCWQRIPASICAYQPYPFRLVTKQMANRPAIRLVYNRCPHCLLIFGKETKKTTQLLVVSVHYATSTTTRRSHVTIQFEDGENDLALFFRSLSLFLLILRFFFFVCFTVHTARIQINSTIMENCFVPLSGIITQHIY